MTNRRGQPEEDGEHDVDHEEATNFRGTTSLDSTVGKDENGEDNDVDDAEQQQQEPIKAKKNVFIKDEEHTWLPARILEQTSDDTATATATVQVFDLTEDGRTILSKETRTVFLQDYPPTQALPLKNVNAHKDMIDLPFLHEPGILYNLRTRYFQNQPYTRTGDILIAVNPYQWLSHIYTTTKRQQYMPTKIYDSASKMVKKSVEPHVYEISAMSFRGLALEQKNQSILVSGESGAGKTETVKILLDQIATIQGGLKRPGSLDKKNDNDGKHEVQSSIVQRVVDSNPLLEAFGNAKTLRNDNSSRFGKFVQLQFDQTTENAGGNDNSNNYNCTLVGSHIEVYLLEKSRVITHTTGERNFHIFYQLLSASDDIKRKIDPDILIGKTPASFPYLGSKDNKVKSMKVARKRQSAAEGGGEKEEGGNAMIIDNQSDSQWFEETLKELEIIGIKDDKLLNLMRALCVVLQLGTIKFMANDEDNAKILERQICSGGEFDQLAKLMGIDVDVLSKAFVNKTITAGGQEISSPLSFQQAQEGCHAFAKDLYSKIFDYLVATINAATSASDIHKKANRNKADGDKDDGSSTKQQPEQLGMIGVLDIFGFEAFEKNQFEQLCINYANERLQYMFASNVFVTLIDEYTREGLVVDFSYETNTNVINLIAGKVGILAILNEECIRPGGNVEEFVYKALLQNKSSPRMFKTKQFTRLQFGVSHYAGPVVYTATDFLSTNKDVMPIDLQKVSRSSTNTVIATQYAEPVDSNGQPSKRVRRNKTNLAKNTVASKFRTQLNSLLNTLQRTQTRYIRCIKPNRMKQPRIMENTEILRQLQSGGVIAAIKIASASYPNKMEHHAITKRFRNLADKPDRTQDIKIQVSTLLEIALKDFISPIKGGTPRPPFAVGNTTTYFRTGALEYLENGRNENIGFFAIIIQRNYRMAPIRKSFLKQRKAAVAIQAIMRGIVWKRRVGKMQHCALLIGCWCRCVMAKLKLKKYKSAVKIQRRWRIAWIAIQFERRSKAAISIQRIARGSMQRPKFRTELVQKTNATVLIQKNVRGHIQYVKFQDYLTKKRLKEKKAATQIQRAYRGYSLRRKLKAVIAIQSIVRGYNQRGKFKIALEEDKSRKTKASTHIQKMARGYIQRINYRAMLKAEQERIAAEKAAEEARLKVEQLAAEKAAEEERIAAEKAAKEARLKAEKLEEEKRIATEKRVEEERLASEKRVEQERREAEKKAEHERLEAEKKAEQERIAVEKLAEKERLVAERKAQKEKLRAEKLAEKERLIAKKKEEERLEKERLDMEEKKMEEERLEDELLESDKIAREEGARKEISLEERLVIAEKRAEEERLKAEKLAAENAMLSGRINDNDAMEQAMLAAQEKAAADNEAKEEPDEDEQLELAMEMALLAAQNPDLAPDELNKLLGKPTVDAQPASGGGFFGMVAQGFGQLAKATTAPAQAPVVDGAPWMSPRSTGSPSLGQFLANAGGRSVASPLGRFLGGSGEKSRSGFHDDDTIAESVMTMMLPDSLTAGELRNRRVDLKLRQDVRKLKKDLSEKNRDLRKLRALGDNTRASNQERLTDIAGRHESVSIELEYRLQELQHFDVNSDFAMEALEQASTKLGLGKFDDQKSSMGEEEKLQFDVQILQEAQLVRQMKHMHATGLQKSLHKKFYLRDVEYMKSCKTWLSDSNEELKMKTQKLEESMKEMRKIYEETLWRQEAAFARHDPNMTIRETLDDLF